MANDCPEHVTVQVRFEGICINVERKHHPDLACEHRVVVPNVAGQRDIWGCPIDSHAAGYAFSLDVGAETPLTGATLRITNACTTASVIYDESYNRIPNLTTVMQELGGRELGPISPAAVNLRRFDAVSCWFDVDAGRISACMTGEGAAVTVIDIDCHGEPLLELVPFPSQPLKPSPVEIPTRQMYVWNESDGPGCSDDFLLSYLVAEYLPIARPPIPPNPSGIVTCPGGLTRKDVRGFTRKQPLDDVTDIGCSNSTYP